MKISHILSNLKACMKVLLCLPGLLGPVVIGALFIILNVSGALGTLLAVLWLLLCLAVIVVVIVGGWEDFRSDWEIMPTWEDWKGLGLVAVFGILPGAIGANAIASVGFDGGRVTRSHE